MLALIALFITMFITMAVSNKVVDKVYQDKKKTETTTTKAPLPTYVEPTQQQSTQPSGGNENKPTTTTTEEVILGKQCLGNEFCVDAADKYFCKGTNYNYEYKYWTNGQCSLKNDCDDDGQEVCGFDNKTYSSACSAQNVGVNVSHKGRCSGDYPKTCGSGMIQMSCNVSDQNGVYCYDKNDKVTYSTNPINNGDVPDKTADDGRQYWKRADRILSGCSYTVPESDKPDCGTISGVYQCSRDGHPDNGVCFYPDENGGQTIHTYYDPNLLLPTVSINSKDYWRKQLGSSSDCFIKCESPTVQCKNPNTYEPTSGYCYDPHIAKTIDLYNGNETNGVASNCIPDTSGLNMATSCGPGLIKVTDCADAENLCYNPKSKETWRMKPNHSDTKWPDRKDSNNSLYYFAQNGVDVKCNAVIEKQACPNNEYIIKYKDVDGLNRCTGICYDPNNNETVSTFDDPFYPSDTREINSQNYWFRFSGTKTPSYSFCELDVPDCRTNVQVGDDTIKSCENIKGLCYKPPENLFSSGETWSTFKNPLYDKDGPNRSYGTNQYYFREGGKAPECGQTCYHKTDLWTGNTILYCS
jgi:hypothetical protein